MKTHERQVQQEKEEQETEEQKKEEMNKRLTALAAAFNTAFSSHRRFPLNAVESVLRGERVSIYSGTPEDWTAALHVTNDEANNTIMHELALTGKTLPPRMREQLSAAATRFEELVRVPHKP